MARSIREIPAKRNGRATVISCDFDGTLCEHKYPFIGEPYTSVIFDLIRFRDNGGKLILWTCRNGYFLEQAVKWCKSFGLEFDAINDDIKEIKESDFGKEKSWKVCADYYYDDRNL